MKKVILTIYTNASQTDIHTAVRMLVKITGAKAIDIMQVEPEELPIKSRNKNK